MYLSHISKLTSFFFSRRKQVHKISPVSYLLRYVISSCSGFFHLMSPFHPLLVIIKSALIWGTCLDEQQQQQCLGTSHQTLIFTHGNNKMGYVGLLILSPCLADYYCQWYSQTAVISEGKENSLENSNTKLIQSKTE